MTFGEAVKKRRNEKGLTQRDLAGMLGVSDMTVSRMEANQSFRMNRYFTEVLATFLGNEVIYQITDDSSAAWQLRNFIERPVKSPRYNDNSQSTGVFHKSPFKRIEDAQEKADYCGRLLSVIYTQGIPVVRCELPPRSDLLQGFDICCEYKQKIWVLDVYNNNYYPDGTVPFDDLLKVLYTRVGRATFEPNIQKYSLLVEAERLGPTDILFSGMCTKQLNFDVSILQYIKSRNKISSELDLAFHDDGSGFFDLSVPGCEDESAKLLATWKASFAKL